MRFRPLALTATVLVLMTATPLRAADFSVTISQGVDVDTLSPIRTTNTPTFNVVAQIYDQLGVPEGPGKYVPQLATSWKRLGPTLFEFKLRKNVKFSNGDPFTADDVRFTVEKIKDPTYRSTQGPYVREIVKIETPDPYTVRFTTATQQALFPGLRQRLYIVDSKYWRAHDNAYLETNPVGTGPYVLKSWHKDDAVELDINPNYWGPRPAVKHVIFKPIPDAASRVAALRTNETDLITNVPPQYVSTLVSGRNTDMASVKSVRILYIAFNTLQPGPQQNKLVRQALNYALDVPSIIKNVLGGRAYPVPSVIPTNFFGFDPHAAAYTHDVAKAKALLAKAGYPDGKGIDLVLQSPNGRYNRDKEICEAVAGQLALVGVHVTVKTNEWTNYTTEIAKKQVGPMFMLGWGVNNYDADGVVTGVLTSDAPNSAWVNPEFDKTVFAARAELDTAKRQALYVKAQAIAHEDAPWLFLFQFEDLYAVSKRISWQPRGDESIDVKLIKPR